MRSASVFTLVNRNVSTGSKLTCTQFKRLKVKRILLIAWAQAGEVILSTMLVQLLRKRYPKAHISYVAWEGGMGILKDDRNIDELIPANAKIYRELAGGQSYDLAIDLYAGGGSRLMAYLSGAKYVVFSVKPSMGAVSTEGLKLVRHRDNNIKDHFVNIIRLLGVKISCAKLDRLRPCLSITKNEALFAARFLEKKGISAGDFVVGLQPARHYEIWPESKYAELAQDLINKYKAKIIIFHGHGEKGSAEKIHSFMPHNSVLLPRLNVRDYFAVLSRCNLLVTTIGGAAHAGAALGVPAAVILCKGQKDYWVPRGGPESFYLPIISKVSYFDAMYNITKRISLLTVSVRQVLDFIGKQKDNIGIVA